MLNLLRISTSDEVGLWLATQKLIERLGGTVHAIDKFTLHHPDLRFLPGFCFGGGVLSIRRSTMCGSRPERLTRGLAGGCRFFGDGKVPPHHFKVLLGYRSAEADFYDHTIRQGPSERN